MKISVIIPSYKPGAYMEECLDSLCNQTLAPGQYEIIIVLNGCNEPYYGRLHEYIHAHPSHTIRLIQTDTGGVCNARNVGIEQAEGEYIAFVDDDDWVTADYLESMLSHVGEGIIVATNVHLCNEADGRIMDYFLTKAYAKNAGLKRLTFFSARSFLSNVCCKVIPRAVIDKDRFNTTYKLGEDSLFMFQISRRIKGIRLTKPETIYTVRYRENSASHSSYPYSYRVKLSLRLTCSYFGLYLRNIGQYDFLLFVSRVVATLRKLFYRKYE